MEAPTGLLNDPILVYSTAPGSLGIGLYWMIARVLTCWLYYSAFLERDRVRQEDGFNASYLVDPIKVIFVRPVNTKKIQMKGFSTGPSPFR